MNNEVPTSEHIENQKIKIELERNKCLKGIWDELKEIKNLKKLELGVSPIINACRSVEELDLLAKAIANPTEFIEGDKINANNESA